MKKNLAQNLSMLLLAILVVSSSASVAQGALSPFYKECIQRGFVIGSEEGTGDEYCIFPDKSQCSLESMNNGTCNNPYVYDDYCVQKGNAVWDQNKCCKGLVPYLPEGMEGQTTCQPIQYSSENSIFSSLKEIPLISPFIFLLILAIFICMLLIFLFEKKKK
jgi:hypothetical protein